MKYYTEEQAVHKRCPFINSQYCLGSNCMAWREFFPYVSRENHSGGKDMIYQLAAKIEGSEVKTKGSGGEGISYLEARGHCMRLIPRRV